MLKKSYWKRFQLHSKNVKQGGHQSGLDALFEYFDFEDAGLDESVEWLEKLALWLRYAGGEEHHPHTRVRFLLLLLESNLEWKTKSSMLLQRVLLDSYFFRLFSDTGVPSGNAFSREFTLRLVSTFFPNRGKTQSIRTTLGSVFSHVDDLEWLSTLPEGLWSSVYDWVLFYKDLNFQKRFYSQTQTELHQAVKVLSVRCVSIAYREELMERAAEESDSIQYFLELFRLLESYLKEPELECKKILYKEIAQAIEKCRTYLEAIYKHLEEYGVSLEIVFQLERATLFLSRIEILLKLDYTLCEGNKENLKNVIWKFFLITVEGIRHDNRVRYWVRENLKLLSQKIVEHTGKVGEDAIARNKKDYYLMFLAAGGGGAITAFTAFFKLHSPHSLPPFIEAILMTINYSVSFILMHYFHFKLATKQPSVMATALAQKIQDSSDSSLDKNFAKEVTYISGTQFAAVAGNIVVIIPIAALIHYLMFYFWSIPSVNLPEAQYTLKSVHPFATLTIFYAAWTGVLLWISALLSGWIENAYVFYRIPEAFKTHRFLRSLVGEKKLVKIVDHISEHLIGVSSSIGLGVLLAFSPIVSKFFGFPLDVRHVTITTGKLTFSALSQGLESISVLDWMSMIVSVVFIGFLNFGVSFWLALSIATRARDLPKSRIKELFKSVFLRFKKTPIEFLFPYEAHTIKEKV